MSEEINKKLTTHPDFVVSKRFENSLQKVLEKHPDGCSDRLIASLLGLPEEEIESRYQEIVEKLKELVETPL